MGKLVNPYLTPTVDEAAVDSVIKALVERGCSIDLKAQAFKDEWSVSILNVIEADGTTGTLIYIPGVHMDQAFKKGTFSK